MGRPHRGQGRTSGGVIALVRIHVGRCLLWDASPTTIRSPLKGTNMRIESVPVSTRTPVTGRAVLRVGGALLALTTVFTVGLLVVQSAPAQAGGSGWAGTGAVLPSNADTPNASEIRRAS